MSAQVIQLPGNMHTIRAVRAAINARASVIRAPEDQRRHAVIEAFSMIRNGSSAAWAVSEAVRMLKSPSLLPMRGPTPPEAA